jgi:hypothetical protein
MKVNLKPRRREGADWIHSTQDRFECRDFKHCDETSGSIKCAECLD